MGDVVAAEIETRARGKGKGEKEKKGVDFQTRLSSSVIHVTNELRRIVAHLPYSP
jgi:hypothetical protein